VVESRIVVEIKATRCLANEHVAQTINYLRASGHPIGLLFNFGQPRLEFKRLLNNPLAAQQK
jgi:GxxExxY protein